MSTKIMAQKSNKTKEEAENGKHFILWTEMKELKRGEGEIDVMLKESPS